MESCSDRWCFSRCQLVMYMIASRCFPVALLRPPSTIAQKLVRSLRLFAWDEARASTLCSVRWCRRSSGVALCGAFAALISCRLGRPCFFLPPGPAVLRHGADDTLPPQIAAELPVLLACGAHRTPSGQLSARRRTDFGFCRSRVRPKPGPEFQFPARKN